MATNEIKNGCGSSIEAVLASNQKTTWGVLDSDQGPNGGGSQGICGGAADLRNPCKTRFTAVLGRSHEGEKAAGKAGVASLTPQNLRFPTHGDIPDRGGRTYYFGRHP